MPTTSDTRRTHPCKINSTVVVHRPHRPRHRHHHRRRPRLHPPLRPRHPHPRIEPMPLNRQELNPILVLYFHQSPPSHRHRHHPPWRLALVATMA